MLTQSNGQSGYFDAIGSALGGVEALAGSKVSEARQNNIIYDALNTYVQLLRHSFDCWKLKTFFVDSFKIDRTESGFPLFKNVVELETDAARAEEALLDLPPADQIREEMLELMLKYKQVPANLKPVMARRLYFEALAERPVFTTFSKPVTLRISYNPRSQRTFYVMSWATYDGTENLPMVYMAAIEDSSDSAPRPEKNTPHGIPKGWFESISYDGLPNFELREQFRSFVANHVSYKLNLTTIAQAIDTEFETLHPKQLRRFVLGPFYAGGLTEHNQKVQSVLDSVSSPKDSWLYTWTMQELHSKEEVRARNGIWGSAPVREVFHINTEDLDCAAQGISHIERFALVPHSAYQSLYAKQLTGEVFDGHRCYIASGGHILKNV